PGAEPLDGHTQQRPGVECHIDLTVRTDAQFFRRTRRDLLLGRGWAIFLRMQPAVEPVVDALPDRLRQAVALFGLDALQQMPCSGELVKPLRLGERFAGAFN